MFFDHAKGWLRRLDTKHPELLKEAVDRIALAHIEPEKPHTHTFSRIEVFPNNFRGLRLPLCRGRTMLLDKPLPLLPNGRQDVVGFMDYLENPRPPMAAADVAAYLAARMADEQAPLEQRKARQGKLTTAKTSDSGDKLVWKYRYRHNLIQFWLGSNCPKDTLDEVITAHARIAPYFRNREEAVAILKEFVREIPEEARACSSRLLKKQFGRIDKNIVYAVRKAFEGNTNQPEPGESNPTSGNELQNGSRTSALTPSPKPHGTRATHNIRSDPMNQLMIFTFFNTR